MRTQGTQIEGVNRSGHRDGLVLDDVDRAKFGAPGSDLGFRRRAVVLKSGEILGVSESDVRREWRVRRDADAHRRGGNRDRDERKDQYLLTPFTTQQSPRPPDDRASSNHAAVAALSRSSIEHYHVGHDVGPNDD